MKFRICCLLYRMLGEHKQIVLTLYRLTLTRIGGRRLSQYNIARSWDIKTFRSSISSFNINYFLRVCTDTL
jgi:hypothetical protein